MDIGTGDGWEVAASMASDDGRGEVSFDNGRERVGAKADPDGDDGDDDDDSSFVWDLPLSLAGKIVSYKTGTTADAAEHREVSRSFGHMIRGQISSKNSRHTIACPGRLDNDKSFVPALIDLGWSGDERPIVTGDLLDCTDMEHSLFPGDITLERLFMLGTGEEDEFADTPAPDITEFHRYSPGGGRYRPHEVRDAVAALERARSLDEFESVCKGIILGGLCSTFDERGEDLRDERHHVNPGDYCTQSVVAVLRIPPGSDSIGAQSGEYLELQTSGLDDVADVHPVQPNSLFVAHIVEANEVEGGTEYRVKVLMDILYDWDIEGELVSSLGYDLLREEHQNRIGPVEGVVVVDDFLGEDLVKTLTANIDALAAQQEEQNAVDYHPHSNDIVRDMVHPGLYSYVKGMSELRASVNDVQPCSLPRPASEETEQARAEIEDDGYGAPGDFWGRNEWDKYQWLPTYFDISTSGECTIQDYINGLTPREDEVNCKLHNSLAKLFGHALPYVNSVYSYVRAVRPVMREGEEEDNEDIPDEIGGMNVIPYDLRGQKLQVITKIVDYELSPGQSHEGVWHIEGMSQEDIVLTVLYIVDRNDDISGGDIIFKRAFLRDEAGSLFWGVAQSRPMALEREIENGLVPLGKVKTPKGRLIVFPNSHVHKVTEMVNDVTLQGTSNAGNGMATSKRRIVVFFLVNPHRRIVSTREVAPQKGGSMSHQDALLHRLELMKARRLHKQDWNVREIHLCEH